MKILVTLRFFIIAEIFSSTIADQGTSQKIPSHLAILGFGNTTMEDIEEFDRALCTINGGLNAYDNQKKAREHYTQCRKSVDQEITQATMTAIIKSRGRYTDAIYMQEYCRRISSSGNCIRELTDSMKVCLDVEKHESANIIYNIYNSVMEYICKDTSEIGNAKFDSLFECGLSKYPALERCMNQTLSKYFQTTISNGAAIGGVGFLHLLIPDVNKCTVLENFQHCVVGVLKNCTPSISMDIPNSMFNIVKEVTTCNHLLKSQASPARFIDTVLITVVTVMSLRFLYTKH